MYISIRKKMMMMVKKNIFFKFLWMSSSSINCRLLLILFACRQYHTFRRLWGWVIKKLEGKKWLNYTSNPFPFFFLGFRHEKKLNFFLSFSIVALLFNSIRFQLSRQRNFSFLSSNFLSYLIWFFLVKFSYFFK